MRILIAGGTGFIGSQMIDKLAQEGHEIFVLTRNPESYDSTEQIKHIGWLKDGMLPERQLPAIDAVINLAGESLNSGRWTGKRKQTILNSRVQSVKEIIRIMKEMPEPPDVFVQASAIGFYGTSLHQTFTERQSEPGNDFLARVVSRWEQEAHKAESLIRTVIIRFGVVLGHSGGALPKMLMPYKLFIGGNIGSGNQWMSWIHLDDLINLVQFSIMNDHVTGILNGTAPNPVRNQEFGETIGQLLNRPHWLPVPSFVLNTIFGEMSILLLKGQKVLPEQPLQLGFSFQYPELKRALESIIQNRKKI